MHKGLRPWQSVDDWPLSPFEAITFDDGQVIRYTVSTGVSSLVSTTPRI